MDRFETMRVFVAVAETQGFAAAARRLAMSPPAVTRAVLALEDRIGARLLHRTTRVVRLTDAGARFLADCKRILAEVDEAEASAAGSHAEPRGQIGVTAPILFGRMHVVPIILDFLERYPNISTRLLFRDSLVDLIGDAFDVAIRIAHLPDSSLRAIQVGSVRRVVCASRAYLAAHGTPRTPDELSQHETIAFSASAEPAEWTFAAGRTVTPAARFTVSGSDVAIAAAVAGRGITRVLSYQVASEVRAGRLEIILADFEPPLLPINVVYAEGLRAAARVRTFVDFAVDRLRTVKALT
jgi:DNA-binding transcriptional LysR family regulator